MRLKFLHLHLHGLIRSKNLELGRELSKRATGKTLYLIDEPTTGLSFYDVHKLSLIHI